jgi:signal transduction histidine kinase
VLTPAAAICSGASFAANWRLPDCRPNWSRGVEFRTPLTSLRHITGLLEESDDLPPGRRQSLYGVLSQSTERLHRLVESLLDFARMEDGRKPWSLRPLDVSALVAEVVASFRREHPDVTIHCDAPNDVDIVVQADADAGARVVEPPRQRGEILADGGIFGCR